VIHTYHRCALSHSVTHVCVAGTNCDECPDGAAGHGTTGGEGSQGPAGQIQGKAARDQLAKYKVILIYLRLIARIYPHLY